MKNFELFTNPDGSILVRHFDGRTLTIDETSDGDAYDFAVRYLGKLSTHYRGHLYAADLLLRRQYTATEYREMKDDIRTYNLRLALQSMHCIFGAIDNIPDCDAMGNLNVEFVQCPMRGTCPFNGYKHRDSHMACCNPIYETPLTRRQAAVADLLVNTSYSNEDIATALGVSTQRVKNHTSEIYAAMGVANRQELTLLLRNKRIV